MYLAHKDGKPIKRYHILTSVSGTSYRVMKVDGDGSIIVKDLETNRRFIVEMSREKNHELLGIIKCSK